MAWPAERPVGGRRYAARVDATATDRAARLLAECRRAGIRFAGFPRDLHPLDEAAGYAVQESLHGLLEAGGHGPQGGHKIGCTTSVMQEYLGIRNPSAGGVLAATILPSGATRPLPVDTRLGVECEIAVRLGRDLPGADASDLDRVAAAVGAWMASIEIVEDRYVEFPALDAPSLIADDFFGAGLVLGAEIAGLDAREADAFAATMTIAGATVGAGRGADILGHPLKALAWLATHLDARGRPLRAGEVATLGSLVATVWIDEPGEVVVDNDALGAVTISFTH